MPVKVCVCVCVGVCVCVCFTYFSVEISMIYLTKSGLIQICTLRWIERDLGLPWCCGR